MASDTERNKDVIREFAGAINARDWGRLDRVVAPDFVRHSHAAPGVRSREELKQYLRSEFETFPDARETVEDILAEGDKVAVRHGFRGTQLGAMATHPPSGRTLTSAYIAIYRLERGVIVEAWAEWDNLSGLAQLGHHQPGD
jgi:steroid delta-isomerase-like uncharacterized protein